MERQELEEIFAMKIGMELSCFKKRLLRKKPEDILAEAYHADCMINIYETLMEGKYPEKVLRLLSAFPGLLEYLYHAWLKEEDSYRAELELCMNRVISGLSDTYRLCETEEKKTVA